VRILSGMLICVPVRVSSSSAKCWPNVGNPSCRSTTSPPRNTGTSFPSRAVPEWFEVSWHLVPRHRDSTLDEAHADRRIHVFKDCAARIVKDLWMAWRCRHVKRGSRSPRAAAGTYSAWSLRAPRPPLRLFRLGDGHRIARRELESVSQFRRSNELQHSLECVPAPSRSIPRPMSYRFFTPGAR
jgi:hypothetical protein